MDVVPDFFVEKLCGEKGNFLKHLVFICEIFPPAPVNAWCAVRRRGRGAAHQQAAGREGTNREAQIREGYRTTLCSCFCYTTEL